MRVVPALSAMAFCATAGAAALKDPRGVFCGSPDADCYKVLGLDRNCTSKEVKKAYRKLSVELHPDKNGGTKQAEENFAKVAKAQEVLTNGDKRKRMDYYIRNPGRYWMVASQDFVLGDMKKNDVRVVLLLVLLVVSIGVRVHQASAFKEQVKKVEQAAVENRPNHQGGSPEIRALHDRAAALVAEDAKAAGGAGGGAAAAPGKADKGRKVGRTGKESARKEAEDKLRAKVALLLKDEDLGLSAPTWRDFVLVQCAVLPFRLAALLAAFAAYKVKRATGAPLTDDEKDAETEKVVGAYAWAGATDREREALLARELWVAANAAAYRAEQPQDPEESGSGGGGGGGGGGFGAWLASLAGAFKKRPRKQARKPKLKKK